MRSLAKLLIFSIMVVVVVLADDSPQVTSEVRPEQVLPPDILTNEGVVLLSNSGFSDAFIAEKIQLSRTRLDSTVEGLTYLRHNSVSEELIRYIMERTAQPPIAIASAPNSAPTPAPTLVPLNLVRTRVLVPQTVMAIPMSSAAVNVGIPMYTKKAPHYGWYLQPVLQPTDAPPGYSVMPSSAFTAGGAANGWMATR